MLTCVECWCPVNDCTHIHTNEHVYIYRHTHNHARKHACTHACRHARTPPVQVIMVVQAFGCVGFLCRPCPFLHFSSCMVAAILTFIARRVGLVRPPSHFCVKPPHFRPAWLPQSFACMMVFICLCRSLVMFRRAWLQQSLHMHGCSNPYIYCTHSGRLT